MAAGSRGPQGRDEAASTDALLPSFGLDGSGPIAEWGFALDHHHITVALATGAMRRVLPGAPVGRSTTHIGPSPKAGMMRYFTSRHLNC
jgi:hypothetical protein